MDYTPEIAQRTRIAEDHTDDGNGGVGFGRVGGVRAVPGAGAVGDEPTEGADDPDGDESQDVMQPGVPVRGLVLAGDDALEAVKPGLLVPQARRVAPVRTRQATGCRGPPTA